MNQEEKPHAPSCDKNRKPLLDCLWPLLKDKINLLEVGSGTGQHAVFMAPKLPHLTWTISDVKDRHRGMSLWLREEPILNIKGPLLYEVGKVPSQFPKSLKRFDVVFTSNTLHILNWEKVKALFKDLNENLEKDTLFITYGAFKFNGKYTTESNKDFDVWLKQKDKNSGLKNFEDVTQNLLENNFSLLENINMPANNNMLVYKKK
jgi:cyclopropane fatty-acyl-phospholipid synthase-like methyltransferase